MFEEDGSTVSCASQTKYVELNTKSVCIVQWYNFRWSSPELVS